MAETKQVLTRIKLLDELLSDQYHDYNMDDIVDHINDRLEDMGYESVTRRAIEKDIKYLVEKSPFGVFLRKYKVTAYNGEKDRHCVKYCLKYEDPGFSIFKKDLNDDEKYLLSETLKLIGQFEGLPNFEALEYFRKSLNLREEHRKIVSFTRNDIDRSSLFGQLFTAISQKQVIELHYHTFQNMNEVKVLNFHPQMLKEYNRSWFLFATAETDGKLLSFPLDRIDEVVPLPSHSYIEYDGDLEERSEEIIGVTFYEDKPVEHILFWVTDHEKGYIETKPLHSSQTPCTGAREKAIRASYPDLNKGAFYSIDCRFNYELIRELCSYGAGLVVLSSTIKETGEEGIVKRKVIERVQQMKERYKLD